MRREEPGCLCLGGWGGGWPEHHGVTLRSDLGSKEEELGELRKGIQPAEPKEMSLLESQVRRNGGNG